MNKYLLTEKEYGCGAILVDGYPCTSLGKDPNLCSECIKRLVSDFESQDRKSRKMQLKQLEKEGVLRCDFTIQRGKNRCYRKTCRRCAALREVGA